MNNLSDLQTDSANIICRQIRESLHGEAKPTKTIWLDRPYNLYLADCQTDAYLRLMKANAYSGAFHDPVAKLISAHTNQIIEQLPLQVDLFDLGPGYPDKTFPILEAMSSLGFDCLYIPVDIGKRFLGIASDAVEHFKFPIKPLHCLFEELPNKLKNGSVARKEAYRLALLGLTFMNYRPDKILPLLGQIIEEHGLVVVATQLWDGGDVEPLLSPYRTTETQEFAFLLLALAGIDRSSVNYDLRFADGRVEVSFVTTRDLTLLDGTKLAAKTRLITAISYRYQKEEFLCYLSEHFSSANVIFSQESKVALGLAANVNSKK